MKYFLKDITLYGYHGLHDDEKVNGQYYTISISYDDLSLNKLNGDVIKKDSIENYINYIDVFLLVKKVFHNKRYNLIETLASNIHKALIDTFDVTEVEIKVTKKLYSKYSSLNEVSFTYKK